MNYSAIKYCDIANGTGVRTVLFVSGCRNHCKGCFQPETWDFAHGEAFTKEVEDAARAGAEYMISPNMNVDVIKKTKELGKGSMPGALTTTEVVTAYEAGADVVKIFPAGNFGESYIKALQGPCDFIPYAAVGGVNADNMKSLMEAGYNMVAVGGNLVNKDLVIKEDYQKITELAKQYVQNI